MSSTWDTMLPGPPTRSNFGSADITAAGLLAFASGSSITILESRSLQIITTIPLPPPPSSSVTSTTASAATSSASLSPFVTSIKWTPLPLPRDLLSTEPSSSHLTLAAGDRHGRIALLDFRSKSIILWLDTTATESAKYGVQDLCWILSRTDSYVLAAINGPSLLSLYNTSTGRCFFKYDASPELLSCVRRDPFDSRRFCVIGLKGFFLSLTVLGDTEDDSVVIKELKIGTDFSEFLKLEKDAYNAGSGGSGPASAMFPTFLAKFAFSPHWRHIVFITFPRELVVFDLQYETTLYSAALPRGCSKFLDVLPDPDKELVYCAHLNGKVSIWRRKE
ncbi:hypothetical protein ACFE04_009926 [Oxalis oulophora]